MLSALSYFCGISAAVFVAVSLTIAAVRRFHMCRPYDHNPNCFYPGRPYTPCSVAGLHTLFRLAALKAPTCDRFE